MAVGRRQWHAQHNVGRMQFGLNGNVDRWTDKDQEKEREREIKSVCLSEWDGKKLP